MTVLRTRTTIVRTRCTDLELIVTYLEAGILDCNGGAVRSSMMMP